MEDFRPINSDACRILLVEDDQEAALEIIELCNLHGYEVSHATNSRELLEFMNHSDVDVVICDINLPGMSGIEIIGMLRDELTLRRKPQFIFITGHGDMELAIEALRLGAIDFLNKPLSGSELIKTIGRAILRGGHNKDLATMDPETASQANPSIDEHLRSLAAQFLEFEMTKGRMSTRNLFGDPSWTLMLALFLADFRNEVISASNLSIDAGVPLSTSTRRLIDLEADGFLSRSKDALDSRRVLISLSSKGRDFVREHLQIIGSLRSK